MRSRADTLAASPRPLQISQLTPHLLTRIRKISSWLGARLPKCRNNHQTDEPLRADDKRTLFRRELSLIMAAVSPQNAIATRKAAMKVLVAVKRVLDYNVRPHVKVDGTGIDLSNVKMSINPFDEIGIEEAIRLKEKKIATEAVLVSIGSAKSQDTLRAGLAMGADRAILIETNDEIEPLAVAKLLKAIVEEEQPGLVILGKQAIDHDNNQTGQMLAGLLRRPQGTFVSKIEVRDDEVTVACEVDTGIKILRLKMPAIVTTDLRLNEPRYPSLPNIMKAKTKPLVIKTPEDYAVDITPRLKTLKVSEPPKRQAGTKVADVDELIAKLRKLGVLT
jgi:electron transfer flavoprotein beta subunit